MDEVIEKIVNAAIQAPSGENCQPWKFQVKDYTINLYNIPERDQSIYSWGQRASYVAHGALLENVIISAADLGYVAQINLFPNKSNADYIAKIQIEKSLTEKDSLVDYIYDRTTNRRPYKDVKLSNEQKSSLLANSEDIDGAKFKLVEDINEIEKLANVGSANERIMLQNKDLHNFFFSHITWTEKEDCDKKLGFFIKTFELTPPAQVVFKMIKRWPVMKTFNRVGFPEAIGKQNAKINMACSAIGGIIIDNDDPISFITAGRLLQRVWLTATKLGLSMQPLAGVLFMSLMVKSGDTEKISETHRGLIEEKMDDVKKIFNVGDKTVAMMFRIGTAEPPSAHALRLEPIVEKV